MQTLSTQLLVIGGGAIGLGMAWDASLRGLKVVLVEQGDLGQGTSGRYHGLLHSGGRYVISDPPSARDCARENQILRSIASHTIEDTGGLFVSTPTDPQDFAEKWLSASLGLGLPVQELTNSSALRLEPLLNPRMTRAFQVLDATMDSFDLLHTLVETIRGCGGQVWLRHRLEKLVLERGRVVAAEVRSLPDGEHKLVGADFVVNAAGPWASQVARMAGVHLPLALGRGTMVAMASRLVHTVINRCRAPSDGDIAVPVGTVTVLGTTDVLAASPTDLTIEPWEVDLLLAEGEVMLPGLANYRPLRAWSGIRPLYRPETSEALRTRELPRGHCIVNHGQSHGVAGFLSVLGGKLTTFRSMAEEAMTTVCAELGVDKACTTDRTVLSRSGTRFHQLPERLRLYEERGRAAPPPQVVCECEIVTADALEAALRQAPFELDDIRRDLRLGMGPCQSGFCAYRAAGIANAVLGEALPSGGFQGFVEERWRGVRPVAWGSSLRQLELTRRFALEMMAAHRLPGAVE